MPTQLEIDTFCEQVPPALEALAGPHVNNPDSGLALLPHDPANYPGQNPMDYHIKGKPMYSPDSDLIAAFAQKGFLEMRDDIEVRQGTLDIVAEAIDWVKGGGNIAVVTPHTEMTDIAVALLTFRDLMTREGYTPDKVSIILSKMLCRIAYVYDEFPDQKVEAIKTLQLLCNDIYMCWPRTDSAKPIVDTLNQEIASMQNKQMYAEFQRQLRLGGVVVGLAATGTTQVQQTESGEAKLADINDKTADLLIEEKTLILPMVTRLKPLPPYIAFVSRCINAKTHEEVRLVMRDIEIAHNALVKNAGINE